MSNLEPRDIHLRDYWNVVWRGRYTVLTVLVLALALALLRVYVATPMYRATAVIEIKPEARSILPGQEQWVGSEGRSWISEELYFNTQLEILRSRDLASLAAGRLPPEDRALLEERFGEDVAGGLKAMVAVSPRVNTRLVELSVVHEDPERAARFANELARTYERRNVDEAARAFEKIMDRITRDMQDFRLELGEADTLSFDTAEGEQLFVPEDQRAILTQNLEKYNDELASIQVELATLRADLDGYERFRRNGGDIMALSRFAQDTVLQELNATKLTLERDLERLTLEGKTARHPETAAKTKDLETVEARMAEQVDVVAQEMRESRRTLGARASNLQAEIDRTEQRAHDLQRQASRYELNKTDAESKRRVYDVIAERISQLSMGANLIRMNNNVRVLDLAREPTAPVSPNKPLTAGLGLMLGLVFGVGAVLFLDYLDNTIRTPEDIEQSLGLNVLAIVPRYRGASTNAVREAYQSLRTSILFASRDLDQRVLLLTSAGPQEGKSSTVGNLARSLATSGDRVVVLDCDLRRPTQHKHLEISREPGLTNYLLARGDVGYERFVQATKTKNLVALPCGPVPPNPTDLIGSPRFRDLIARLRQDFDWVVIDSPPVASIADTIVLASLVDLLVMVIKHNENDRDLIRRSLKRLADVDVRIAGAVLNSMQMSGSYGSYYTAYDYYDEDATRGTKPARPDGADRRIAL